MIRGIDSNSDQFLADLERIQTSADRAQRQISSGLKVERPSDAPDEIRSILQLRAEIQLNTQIQTNLNQVKSEANAADTALQSSTQIMDRALALATEAAGTQVTPEQRQSIAQEVSGLMEQLVALSRTNVAGRYVFSGDQDQSPAYDLNPANPNGVDRLLTAGASRQIQDASGVSFAADRTAGQIFDHRNADDTLAPDNVFAAVNGLRVALENNDQPGISASIAAVKQASDYLNGQSSFYGGVQNRIKEALDTASNLQVQEKSDLSSRQDADLPAAIMQLTQAQTQRDASLSAAAKLPKTSLFDFLA